MTIIRDQETVCFYIVSQEEPTKISAPALLGLISKWVIIEQPLSTQEFHILLT